MRLLLEGYLEYAINSLINVQEVRLVLMLKTL
jgi:hypothetical protein